MSLYFLVLVTVCQVKLTKLILSLSAMQINWRKTINFKFFISVINLAVGNVVEFPALVSTVSLACNTN